LINPFDVIVSYACVIVFAAIEQEKGQQRLISGIENFDPKSLKPTETQEKNPLPTQEG
jgi:Thymosin beta-4 family